MSIDILMRNACWKVNNITMIAEWNGIAGAFLTVPRTKSKEMWVPKLMIMVASILPYGTRCFGGRASQNIKR